MTNMLLREFVDRITDPREYLTSEDPGWWTYAPAFTSVAFLVAIIAGAAVALLKLRHREQTLKGVAATHAMSLGQRSEADDRAEWLRRTQWALGAAASTNDGMYSFGAVMLEALARSDLTVPEDKAILDIVWEGSYTKMGDGEIRDLLAECKAAIELETDGAPEPNSVRRPADRGDELHDRLPSGENEATRRVAAGIATRAEPATKDRVFATLRREILAARLKVTLDGQLRRETSPTVIRLSNMAFPPMPRRVGRGDSQAESAEPTSPWE